MKLRLKPVGEQVIVITGADSGIGLTTAREAARRGARVVINSRNTEALAQIADELRAMGTQAEWLAGDVGDERAMRELARVAIHAFGRIDTWVNNAGVGIFGQLELTPLGDARRLFETNYWGMVHGSLAALPHLKARGGALINVGSVESGVPIPLHGHYSASKHAVKGFTDALRMEMEKQDAPVSVTLIRPAAIDTPFTEHSHNHMEGADPELPPPVYAPDVVADAILHCAEKPKRELIVGGAGKQMSAMWRRAPRLFGRYAENVVWEQERAPRGTKRRNDALYAPTTAGSERGDYPGHVMESSAYTQAAESPLRSALLLGLLGVGTVWAVRSGLFDRAYGTARERFTGATTGTGRADRDMQHVLEHLEMMGGQPIEMLSPEEARRQPTPTEAVMALLRKHGKHVEPEPVGSVVDRTIPGPAGPIPVRVYAPQGRGPFPVIVYTHGGGWVIATNDTYDASARALCNAVEAVVVSVEYRKAPEHKFPAAHEDAYTAYLWALHNAPEIDGDPARVAVAGESAGGNLAISTAMVARDRGVQLPSHILAVYPIADGNTESESYRENHDAKPLNRPMMAWFFGHYLRTPADAAHPLISLVNADLKGLPPTTVITAEIDPLRSDGEELAERLRQAGVEVGFHAFSGVTHEFFGMGAVVGKANKAVKAAAKGLRAGFEAGAAV
ncbi:MAG TPA: SDR family oxidoreductase [Longimicrobium sp.]